MPNEDKNKETNGEMPKQASKQINGHQKHHTAVKQTKKKVRNRNATHPHALDMITHSQTHTLSHAGTAGVFYDSRHGRRVSGGRLVLIGKDFVHEAYGCWYEAEFVSLGFNEWSFQSAAGR